MEKANCVNSKNKFWKFTKNVEQVLSTFRNKLY